MAKPDNRKVELQQLMFTMNWEDPALDRAAFNTKPGAQLATVCSGACNTFEFLLDEPAYVFSFDFNPTQVWALELKAACFRKLDYEDTLRLLGIRPCQTRRALLTAVAPAMSQQATDYWSTQDWLIDNGLLNGGRYERFVGKFNTLLRLIQGKRRTKELFYERERDERAGFYETRWDNWRWRLLFKVFFNKTMMSRRGLTADYFHFDDGSGSFAESFARRTKQALVELPVHDNYFFAQYVHGRYLGDHCMPAYLRPENYEAIQARIDRLDIALGDVRDVFDRFEPATFDGICLTNVFELMSEEETRSVLPGVARVLKPGGRMTLRNLMIPRSVPEQLSDTLKLDVERSRELHQKDRSFVYRSFQVYTKQG